MAIHGCISLQWRHLANANKASTLAQTSKQTDGQRYHLIPLFHCVGQAHEGFIVSSNDVTYAEPPYAIEQAMD